MSHSMWNLSSPTRADPVPLALKVWSPNPFTSRKSPQSSFLIKGLGFPFLFQKENSFSVFPEIQYMLIDPTSDDIKKLKIEITLKAHSL